MDDSRPAFIPGADKDLDMLNVHDDITKMLSLITQLISKVPIFTIWGGAELKLLQLKVFKGHIDWLWMCH